MAFRSKKDSKKYSFGTAMVTKNIDTQEIYSVNVLNKFISDKSREDLSAYLIRIREHTTISMIVTNIEGFRRDSLYYPTLSSSSVEHKLAYAYKNIEENISYKQGSLDTIGIKLDDTKGEQIRYRFDFQSTKPITYCIAMAIDATKKNQMHEMLRALK